MAKRMLEWRYALFLTFIVITVPQMKSAGFLATDEKKCQYLRPDRMLKARCYHMDLRDVPQFLKSGIDILDLTCNRIRKLNVTSFENYSGLRYLLLYDNMIQSIQPGTFAHLTSLEEIDLANNALITIPSELLQLPALRNLYVDSNELINLDETLQNLPKPIRAPLEYLNIANCGLHKIPNLGILPYLSHLNASMNPLEGAIAQDLVPMCHLRTLDLRKTSMSPCSCLGIIQYLGNLNLRFTDRIDCDITVKENCYPNISIVDTKDYDACNAVIQNQESKTNWIIIASCIGGSLVALICFLCWYQRRKSNSSRPPGRIEEQNRELLKNSNKIVS